jgi:hypothetical protein
MEKVKVRGPYIVPSASGRRPPPIHGGFDKVVVNLLEEVHPIRALL